jgi:hypothetical protein
MADLFGGALPIDHAAQLEEVRRELALREKVYPRWIENGRLSAAMAKRQIETMQAVLVSLHDVPQLKKDKAQEHCRGMIHAADIAASAGQHQAAATIRGSLHKIEGEG